MDHETNSRVDDSSKFAAAEIGYVEFNHRERLRLISTWPSKWGDNLQFLVNDGLGTGLGWHGAEQAPTDFPGFGITITQELVENSSIGPAVVGIATVPSKTLEGVEDAARRINELLGLLVLTNLGNCTLRWWCYLTHIGGDGSSPATIQGQEFDGFASGYSRLPTAVRRYVRQALYWIRMARGTRYEAHRMDVLRSFDAYWNVVECITAAVIELKPIAISTDEKLSAVRRLHEEIVKRGAISLEDVAQLSRAARPIGERDRLIYAIATLYQTSAAESEEVSLFVRELYDARNRAKHAKVDVERDEVLRRFEHTLQPLKYLALDLLFRMLGRRGLGGWPWIQGIRRRQ